MRVHHVAFRTHDLANLERFYARVLEFAVLRRDDGRAVWLDAAGTILMLERADAEEPPVDARSKDLVCFAIASFDHPRFRRRLADERIALEARTRFTMYFRDPDGRRIGLSSYPDASEGAEQRPS